MFEFSKYLFGASFGALLFTNPVWADEEAYLKTLLAENTYRVTLEVVPEVD